jgi:hypothetical protein
LISKINQAILSKTSPASNSTFTTGRNPKKQNQPTFPLFSLNQHIFIKGYAKNHLNDQNRVKKKINHKRNLQQGLPYKSPKHQTNQLYNQSNNTNQPTTSTSTPTTNLLKSVWKPYLKDIKKANDVGVIDRRQEIKLTI